MGFTFKAAGLWKGRILWEVGTEDGEGVVVKVRHRGAGPEGSKRRDCIQNLPRPGLISSSMSTFISAMRKSYWVFLEVLGQILTLSAPHEKLCRLPRTEGAGQNPGM